MPRRHSFVLLLTILVLAFNAVAQRDEREKTILPRYETAEEFLLRSSILPLPGVAVLPPAHPESKKHPQAPRGF